MSDGKKYDSGKIQPALVLESMSRALMAVAEVATHGAEKYAPDNWLKVSDGLSRYKNAKHRHMLQGAVEHHDSESGLLHAAHEAWNALAVLELMLRAKPSIDRQEQDGWDKQAVDAAAFVNTAVVANVEAFNDWDAGEARINNIGPNGNEGEHYDAMVLPEGVNPSERVNQVAIEVTKRGELAGYLLIDGRIAGRFKPEPKSVPGAYRRNPEHPSVWVR